MQDDINTFLYVTCLNSESANLTTSMHISCLSYFLGFVF